VNIRRPGVDEFCGTHTRDLWQITEMAIERQENTVQSFGECPSFWAADVAKVTDALRARSLAEDSVVFREYAHLLDPSTAVERARTDLARLGELFVAWPESGKRQRRCAREGFG